MRIQSTKGLPVKLMFATETRRKISSTKSFRPLLNAGGQLDPFQKLFSTVLKWQKAEKRIMDGTFLELNAEKTQAEVNLASFTQCT